MARKVRGSKKLMRREMTLTVLKEDYRPGGKFYCSSFRIHLGIGFILVFLLMDCFDKTCLDQSGETLKSEQLGVSNDSSIDLTGILWFY